METAIKDYLEDIKSNIPSVNSTSDYWLVRADSGRYYDDFRINNYVGIGWNEVSLKDIRRTNNDSSKLKLILKDKLPEAKEKGYSERKCGITAGQLLRFCNNIKLNDIVIVPSAGSNEFLVGKVVGEIFEISDEQTKKELTFGLEYEKSEFKKRWPIEWVGSFGRLEADSALFKMIYSHTTLSRVNEYKTFINRALFSCYIEDNKLHLNYQVTEKKHIQGVYLGQFVYQYSVLNEVLFPDTRLDSKINVQSPGVIEFITYGIPAGIFVFGVLTGGIIVVGGGKFKIGKLEFETSGLLSALSNRESKKLDNMKKAKEIAKELKVPMSELGIKYPKELKAALKRIENDDE
ncbi:hypothetical protein [Lactococcus lactis]|uniref:Uncharacterized protein n=1 Tax=Lactococcus lactis TaxID=1358 RepID=A0A6M0M620_9LACT|nr:hypothetical protein [Lactococcus lactis]NEX50792.1 hypothetical protein [Lactococcus lactis]NEX54608.1 hypothetical protein [Lactococcus lactis]